MSVDLKIDYTPHCKDVTNSISYNFTPLLQKQLFELDVRVDGMNCYGQRGRVLMPLFALSYSSDDGCCGDGVGWPLSRFSDQFQWGFKSVGFLVGAAREDGGRATGSEFQTSRNRVVVRGISFTNCVDTSISGISISTHCHKMLGDAKRDLRTR